MPHNLYYNTVTPLLYSVLKTLMTTKEFDAFRLVGGTALSLYKGHRLSVDIDLFTDAEYGSVDFAAITQFLRTTYTYVDTSNDDIIGFGKSYFVGESKDDCIKLDVYYTTDHFIDGIQFIDGIRLASVEEIIAMKLDVISRGGRKKDFWDIHELKDEYTIDQMCDIYQKKHEYTHDREVIRTNFTKFENADEDFDPDCLRNKTWEVIKLDMIDYVKGLS
jgi:predicted nucleotidyltransferase component of viral defense system